MISRIIAFLILPSLIVAMFLSLAGVSAIPFDDNSMYTFFSSVFTRFNNIRIAIPNIPSIPKLEYVASDNFFQFILNALIFVVRFLTIIVNAIVSVINFSSALITLFIQIVEYVLVFIYSLKDLRNILQVSAFI